MHILKDLPQKIAKKLLIFVLIVLVLFVGIFIITKLLEKSSQTIVNSTENLMNKTVELVDKK